MLKSWNPLRSIQQGSLPLVLQRLASSLRDAFDYNKRFRQIDQALLKYARRSETTFSSRLLKESNGLLISLQVALYIHR